MSYTKGKLEYSIVAVNSINIISKENELNVVASIDSDNDLNDLDIANARRIVQCWNSHDTLLEACKKVEIIKLWASTINYAPSELFDDIEFVGRAIVQAIKETE